MAKHVASSTLASPPDTYFFTLVGAADKFAVIGSDDALRVFDLPRLQSTSLARACNTGVTCLASSADGQAFYTAGRDGRIRSFDIRAQSAGLELVEPKHAGFSAIACREHYIAAGTESTKEGLGDVSVLIFDTRKSGTPLRVYNESHTDSITDLAWHPRQSNLLLSGSTDGLVSIFDVDQADEDDAVQQVLNPKSAVHCAGFLTHDQAYVFTTDENFSMYGLDKTGTTDDQALPVAEFGDVRPKLDCMYVINLLQHHSLASPVIAHGHNERGKLALTPLQGMDFSRAHSIDLPGAHGEEVVRDVKIVHEKLAISCGEDGHVRTWAFEPQASMDVDEDDRMEKKKAKREKKDKRRFTPY